MLWHLENWCRHDDREREGQGPNQAPKIRRGGKLERGLRAHRRQSVSWLVKDYSSLVAKGRVIQWGSPFRPGQPANSPLGRQGGPVRLQVASHHRGVPVSYPEQANFLFVRQPGRALGVSPRWQTANVVVAQGVPAASQDLLFVERRRWGRFTQLWN
jgi:hypothetical protein